MKYIYVILSLGISILVVGAIHDYAITLLNLFTVLVFSWVLFPVVKMRSLNILGFILRLIHEEKEEED